MTNAKPQLDVHIRWMIRRDTPEVLDIEEECFEYPWLEEDFVRCLRAKNCIGMVAEFKEEILGFMVYELHRFHIHLLNIAVWRHRQGDGVGRALAQKLFGKLSPMRRRSITTEVRETNLGAQLFLKAVGFKATKILRNYYDNTAEDAFAMKYQIDLNT